MAAELAVWLALAVLVTWPIALDPSGWLLGDPRIDVWNHAWGFWYVADELSRGELPLWTDLAGGPKGGALYFIDTPGAALWAPVTLLFGPAVSYNLALLVRVALSGFGTQKLYEEVVGKDSGRWVAGVACVTLPFLMCELHNGISEVITLHWVAGSMWAAARALRTGRIGDWALLGVLGGLAAAWSFYQGLAAALAVGVLMLLATLGSLWTRRSLPTGMLQGAPLAASCAALLTLPVWLIFKASLDAPDALIYRSVDLHLELMEHNAVDPQIYWRPGDFQSVDLQALYGEPFVHTAYLRVSAILLAALALLTRPKLRIWGVVTLASLVLGLGIYLWWDGAAVGPGDWRISLPFGWLVRALPQVAITHPLRLSVPGQILVCVLAGAGMAPILAWVKQARWPLALAGTVLAGEGMLGSAVRWPLPLASSAVPAVMESLQDTQGMLLPLPVTVGMSMTTSRYHWWQTVHRRPMPYVPDVRLGSARDLMLKNWVGVMDEKPAPLTPTLLAKLRERYGVVILHERWAEQDGSQAYARVLERALGPPERVDGLLIWRVPGDKDLQAIDDSDLGPGRAQVGESFAPRGPKR